MKSIGMARLGRNAELRYGPDGTAVTNLSLAVSYGRKGDDGNYPTQWIEGALWGKQAEALAPYLLKGTLHCFTLDGVHIETFTKSDGSEGIKLAARVIDVELGPKASGNAPAPAQSPPPRPAPAPSRAPVSSGFEDDFGNDPITF